MVLLSLRPCTKIAGRHEHLSFNSPIVPTLTYTLLHSQAALAKKQAHSATTAVAPGSAAMRRRRTLAVRPSYEAVQWHHSHSIPSRRAAALAARGRLAAWRGTRAAAMLGQQQQRRL